MKGINAFCPKTGAPLSEKRHYDDQGKPERLAIHDSSAVESLPEGRLTNGAVRSSKIALFNYFRRCHQRHYDEDHSLYRKAMLGIRRLKRTATDNQEWDVHVWYALQERLSRAGYEIQWMHTHAELRCPECHGRLKYNEFIEGEIVALCGTNCEDIRADRLDDVRGIIAELYSQTFDDDNLDDTHFLDF